MCLSRICFLDQAPRIAPDFRRKQGKSIIGDERGQLVATCHLYSVHSLLTHAISTRDYCLVVVQRSPAVQVTANNCINIIRSIFNIMQL
jgi:hypothetical protein